MISSTDYIYGVLYERYGAHWSAEPNAAQMAADLSAAVEPLLDRIAELMNRCRAAGIDVSDLED